ncbi:MAG: monovalent cation/H+ antiporter subunit D [Burkholderiaceae bacterium]
MAGSVAAAPMAIGLAPHLVAAPILLPLLAGSLAAAVGGWNRTLSRIIGLAAVFGHLAVASWLYGLAQTDLVHVYAMSNWPAPFGIVLVLDRLSATMLLLTSIMATLGLVYANSAWSAEGRRFQALWQFQLMGLSGAFLTGDLFNLFVFFEVLLGASYALLLHGGGRARVGSTFHFVAINLTASAVFLIAVAVLYAVFGTLNMAHLSELVGQTDARDIGLVAVAGVLLLSVFLIKSGLAPFHFWVPASYGSAAAPVVALVVAKVGAYAIVRVFPLLFGAHEGAADAPAAALAGMAEPWVITLAILTLVVGSAGALAAQTLRQLAAMLTLVSIGTLFLPLAVGSAESLSAASFYLVHSTVATATLFVVAEWVGTNRGERGDRLLPGERIAHPIILGGALLWALTTSVGLPPTSGFIGKVLVLASLDTAGAWYGWLWAAVLLSSFCSLVAVSRALSLLLWNNPETEPGQSNEDTPWVRPPSQQHLLAPVQSDTHWPVGAVTATALMVAISAALVIGAGWVKSESERLATQIDNRAAYRAAVLGRSRETLQPLLRPSPAATVPPVGEGGR